MINDKFRAWDKVGKCMVVEGFHLMGEVTALGGIETYICERNEKTGDKRNILDCWNDFELMQYIGKEDRYGKEIYTDDIFKLYDDIYAFIMLDNNNSEYVFYYHKSAGREYAVPLHDYLIHTMEIAGNRFENPELLEVKE